MQTVQQYSGPPRGITRRTALSLALALPFGLGGCFTHKALRPLSDETQADLLRMGLKVGAPLYIRIFKQENEMEAWLGNAWGSYTLFRTYRICNWSGKLGPKVKEGDHQAPEGYYVVSAKQMNPNSQYYLSFNIGYPNAFDLANYRTGSFLMVHGGCKSVGCYAITDQAIQELFSLAREAFTAGQRNFPVHAFPFKMTPERMAEHSESEWIPFWENLKEGYDMFEASKRPPLVGTKGQRYVFFADPSEVPEEYKTQPAADDAKAARLIVGWQ